MRPIPGTITDPAVDRILYEKRPRPTHVRLTILEAEILLNALTYLKVVDKGGPGGGLTAAEEDVLDRLRELTT
jgi:hypothetical protein